jgi:hypothetical protein
MVAKKSPGDPTSAILCRTHGPQAAAVVCGHLLSETDRVLGFVENSSEPTDLQAWCDDCEQAYLREGGMTPAFKKFHDMKVVCQLCYAKARERHSKESCA